MGRPLKNFLFGAGSWMRNSPLLFSINRLRPGIREKCVQPDTGLCIEGFQRSGNTFFELMFELSNPDIKVSHHIHGVANIRRAIKWNVPVVVLIRRPDDALSSLLTYDNRLGSRTAIQAYINYYKKVILIKNECCILHFDELIEDFNRQIDKINSRYGTNFDNCTHDSARVTQIMKERQEKYKNKNATPYPSDRKKKLNAVHKEEIINDSLYSEASMIYNTFIS